MVGLQKPELTSKADQQRLSKKPYCFLKMWFEISNVDVRLHSTKFVSPMLTLHTFDCMCSKVLEVLL